MFFNKKVLLREHKRHTARRVVSTPSVVLTGYPTWQGTPVLTWLGGYPARGVPYLGTPILTWPGGTLPGYPLAGYPLAGYPPAGYPSQGTPQAGPGRVPPWLDLAGYPPRCLPHGILGNVAKHYGIWVPPPGVNKPNKVKLLTSHRTMYAGGKYIWTQVIGIRTYIGW